MHIEVRNHAVINMTTKEIISRLDLKKKASLLCGAAFFSTREMEEYGIERLQLLDGGTGVNYEQLFGDRFINLAKEEGYTFEQFDNATRYFYEDEKLSSKEMELRDKLKIELTKFCHGFDPRPGCYPPGILLGSTWNPEAVYEVGEALGLEAIVYNISCLLGTPNVNLLREPRNGRFFEGYSEDPYLAGELASRMTAGVESQGVASNVKHFAANNLEINRGGINQTISKRALEEMYLPGFKKCVEAGASTLMVAYPKINGKYCTHNSWLLRDVLRERWNYQGLVMTDWGACVDDTGDSVEAGVDLFMPGPWEHEDDIVKAVEEGRLSEENLNKSVEFFINLAMKFKLSDRRMPVSYDEYISQGDKACYEADKEGFVLLKNNGLLPISDMSRINLAYDPELIICGKGSAQVFTNRNEKLKDKFVDSKDGDVDLIVVSIESAEGTDRPDLKLPLKYKEQIDNSISSGKKIILVLNTPGPVEISEYVDKLDAVIMVFYPGMAGAKVLYDVINGTVNPSGKLPFSFPVKYEDTPAYLNYPDSFSCVYGEDIYVGYRGYEKRGVKPLYPFGYGLSYSKFLIKNARLSCDCLNLNDELKVTFVLINDGVYDGSQVVQLYIGDRVSKQNKPLKELKNFTKVYLKAGESKEITLTVNTKDMGSYSDDYEKFLVEDGMYDVYLGFSSEDIKENLSFRLLKGSEELMIGMNSTVLDIMYIPSLRASLQRDVQAHGDDFMAYVNGERYAPCNKLKDIYKNLENYSSFLDDCNKYIKA